RLLGRDGGILADADAVVLAAGAATRAFPQLAGVPLPPVRGELVELPATAASARLRAVLTFGGYLTPATGDRHVAGATYERAGFDPEAWPQSPSEQGARRILAGLPGLTADWFAGVQPVGGRAALRSTTPDRQPVAGPVRPGGLL